MAASIGRFVFKKSTAINEVVFLVKHQACPMYNLTQVMYMRNKHYDPKFRIKRREKYNFTDRSKFAEEKELQEDNIPFLERRKKMKKTDPDAEPQRVFQPRMTTFLETKGPFDPYVPPEGDGKHSIIEKEGIKERGRKVLKKAQARISAIRKIRKRGEENFSAKDIAPELQDIYIEAHNLLTNYKRNKARLYDLVTLNALDKMTYNLDRMTLQWEFVESLEPARVVHVVCDEGIVKDVYFAQVTVRIHTKQRLAIYDQFGRLMYGSPSLEKDILDFVVFEKNIVDIYGKWRILDKITPDWLPIIYKNQSFRLTSKQSYADEEDSNEEGEKDKKKKEKKEEIWPTEEKRGAKI